MYWFTGYIFDTFNELIQMFYARKDLPSIIAAVLLISAYRSRGVCRRTRVVRRAEGRGCRRSSPLPSLPPFLGQNELDGSSVTAVCAAVAFCHLHTLFSLKSELYSSPRGCFSISGWAVRRAGDDGLGGQWECHPRGLTGRVSSLTQLQGVRDAVIGP